MSLQAEQSGVFIVGGGPAGLAAAIAARLAGLQATVADSLCPPIDKACGEGLMPDAVAALQALGVRSPPGQAMPFRGIRFLDGCSGLSTEAVFLQGPGLAIRRTALHARLAERAAEVGVVLRWGTRVTLSSGGTVLCDGTEVRCRWLIGADGLQSRVRSWARLRPSGREHKRVGFRRHVRAVPWTDFVEVYWGAGCQIAVTPTAPDEVGLAMVTRDPQMRMQQALARMPVLAKRLGTARPVARERGAPCVLRRLPALSNGSVVLIGDASGSVDPMTGEGLGLAFQQALSLAESLRSGDLQSYERAHRHICDMPHRMSRLILWMDRSPWLRNRALRALAAEPQLFARLLNAQVVGPPSSPLTTVDALRLGWRMARA